MVAAIAEVASGKVTISVDTLRTASSANNYRSEIKIES